MHTLILLTKYPLPGQVKTRLAASVGNTKACAFQARALQTLINAHSHRGYRLMVGLRQGEYIDRFVQDFGMCIDDIFVQQGDDLGAIMDHAMHVGLETADKTILIGSDTVDISHSEIEEAFVHLETHDMVIGPTNDGGYRMIGSTAPAGDILLDMEYSTQTVYEETLARMDTSSKTYMRMRTHIDVDTIQDLEAARAGRPDIYDEIRQEISTLKTE